MWCLPAVRRCTSQPAGPCSGAPSCLFFTTHQNLQQRQYMTGYQKGCVRTEPITDISLDGIPCDPLCNGMLGWLRAMVHKRSVERGLSAILAADLAGYSRLVHRADFRIALNSP